VDAGQCGTLSMAFIDGNGLWDRFRNGLNKNRYRLNYYLIPINQITMPLEGREPRIASRVSCIHRWHGGQLHGKKGTQNKNAKMVHPCVKVDKFGFIQIGYIWLKVFEGIF
jgi:hypothetical protein